MAVVSDYTALLSGDSWTGGPAGQAVILTYSFSTAPTAYFAGNAAAAASFAPMTSDEQNEVRAALGQWAAVSGITFHETTAVPGDLTFGLYNLADIGSNEAAGLGTYPETSLYVDSAGHPEVYDGFFSEGGDVYIDKSYAAAFPDDFSHAVIHEIGHALGLKHPFDPGGNTLDPALDNGDETVMAYAGTRSPTLGPLDIAAIQYLYGTPDGATHPFAQTWNAATQSLTEVGTAGADLMFGSGGNDVFYSNGGADAISGGEGDDTIYASGRPISVEGGPGEDLVVTGLTYAPDTTPVGGSGTFRYTDLGTGADFQTYSDVETLQFSNGLYDLGTDRFTPAAVGEVDGTTGQSRTVAPTPIAPGGPAYLQSEFIDITPDNLAVSTQASNILIHTGAGSDAIEVASGQNVLDGGPGSNFLTGGSGTDTFFTDARDPGVVWNTIRNIHAGDAVTLWGFVAGVSSYYWETASAGAPGFEGATLRANIVGGAGRTGDGIDASVTFAGMSLGQASRLQLVTGTQAAGSYLYIYDAGV